MLHLSLKPGMKIVVLNHVRIKQESFKVSTNILLLILAVQLRKNTNHSY
jgi:hypothetical protein